MRVGQYTKSVVMILAAGLGIYMAANSDGVVTPVEYVNIGLAILGAILVYLLPNLSSGVGRYIKSIVAFGTAALTALAVIVANAANWDGITQSDWIGVLLAGLAAVGLYILPNSPEAPAVTVINNAVENGEVDPTVGLPETVPTESVDSREKLTDEVV